MRWVTYQENNQNKSMSKTNTSGIKGVSFHKRTNKWCSYISIDGNHKHLGCFESLEDAKQARRNAARNQYGEFVNE